MEKKRIQPVPICPRTLHEEIDTLRTSQLVPAERELKSVRADAERLVRLLDDDPADPTRWQAVEDQDDLVQSAFERLSKCHSELIDLQQQLIDVLSLHQLKATAESMHTHVMEDT